MQFITLTKFTLIPSLIAASFIAGKETKIEMSKSNENKDQMAPGYNASYRINVQRPSDFFITGSFTYWQPIQENMELGVVSNTSHPLDLVHGKQVNLDFDYKPGFKVGIGMNFDYDKWDTFIEYTWFRGTEHVHKNINPNNLKVALLPAWQIPDFLDPKYNLGSEKWKLSMDLIDWDLARGYNVGTQLYFRPFIGVRAALIDQSVHVKYINENPTQFFIWPSTFITQKSDSWGIGPRIGLSSNWKLSKEWRIFGNAEFDILFTQYDLKNIQSSAVSVANRYIVHQDDANYLRAHSELKLGFGWGTYLSSNKYHLDLSADYGFQVFFDQNMFRSTASAQAVGKSTLPNGNLYMQGLTASARFDF